MRGIVVVGLLVGCGGNDPVHHLPDGPPNSVGNLLVNGSFEADVVTASDNCQGYAWCIRSKASTPGWTQILDGVDLIGNPYDALTNNLGVTASEGVQFLDMNQANALGGLQQAVAATVGTTYTVTFDSCGWALNSVPGTISFQLYDPATNAMLATGTFQDTHGGTWMQQTLTAAATSDSIGVSIQQTQTTQAALGVDNVRLVAN
jgi:hypothetical protein